MIDMGFNTQLLNTSAGAKIRIDTWNVTCGWKNPHTGEICQAPNKKFLYAEFNDPSKKKCRIAEIFCPAHLATNWTPEIMVDLIDLIHSGRSFKDIDTTLRNKYPLVPWAKSVIKRRANGEYKEFDCPAKKKYEDLKCNTVIDDVWKPMRCIDAYKKIVWPAKSNRGFNDKINYLLCVACGHEMYWHKNGRCDECNGYCSGDGSNEADKTTI